MRERRLCMATSSQPRASARVVQALPSVSLLAGRAGLSSTCAPRVSFLAPRVRTPFAACGESLAGTQRGGIEPVMRQIQNPRSACLQRGRSYARQLGRFGRIATRDFLPFAKRLSHDTGSYLPALPETFRTMRDQLSLRLRPVRVSTTGYGAGIL